MTKIKYITTKVRELGYTYGVNELAMDRVADRIIASTNLTADEVTIVATALIKEELNRNKAA